MYALVFSRLTQQSVVSFLRSSAKQIWKERTSKKYVVLVDEISTMVQQSEGHAPIISLKDTLCKVCGCGHCSIYVVIVSDVRYLPGFKG